MELLGFGAPDGASSLLRRWVSEGYDSSPSSLLHNSSLLFPRTDFQGGNEMNRISKWTAAVMTGLMISTACLAQDAKKKLAESEIVAALKKELAAQAAADEFSGVVLLAKDGKPLFRQA